MDVPNKSFLQNKGNKYPESFSFIKKYRIPIIAGSGLTLIFVVVFLVLVKNKPNNNQSAIIFPKDQIISSTDNLLETACANALSDYPEWVKTETDLVVWENPDRSFNLRNSPEDASTIMDSPVPPSETLADMDFVGLKEISFVTTNNNSWKIGIFKVNPFDKSFIYEKVEPASFVYISPIDTEQGSELKTLVSYKTAITKSAISYGYWRFKDAHWGVKILEEGSKFVTVWQKY